MIDAKMKPGRRTKATFVKVGFAALLVVGVALAFGFMQEQATGTSAAAPQTTEQLTLIGTSTIHSTPIGSGALSQQVVSNGPALGDEPGVKPGDLRTRFSLH